MSDVEISESESISKLVGENRGWVADIAWRYRFYVQDA